MDDAKSYAEKTWGEVELGDARLARRAVAALAAISAHPGKSFVEASQGDKALQERLYRCVRNISEEAREALIAAGCSSLGRMAGLACEGDIAIVGDTTSYGYSHTCEQTDANGRVCQKLGDLGGKAKSKRKVFFCHVALAVDAQRGTVLGPVDLDLAIRPAREESKPRDHKRLPYEQKESFKWEASAALVHERMSEHSERLIFVNDREADVLEYLMSLIGTGLRFVVRSSWDRLLADGEHLRAKLAAGPLMALMRVHIDQKGGRRARDAVLEVRASPICLNGRVRGDQVFPQLEMNALWLTEVGKPEGIEEADAVKWLLLTSEPIQTAEQALNAVRLYCLRWLIEEYNKCCKSDGTRIEDLRMQSPDSLMGAAVLCMFAAVPIMRLRAELLEQDCRARWPVLLQEFGTLETASEVASEEKPETPEPPKADPIISAPCTKILNPLQWVTLWKATERGAAVPAVPPSCTWALRAIAKLGGWGDTKRTGRPGYQALWRGWDRLLDRVDAVLDALDEHSLLRALIDEAQLLKKM